MNKVDYTRPFLYLEHGTLYRKDFCVLFESNGSEMHIPLDSFLILLVGPGVNLTSNAISFLGKNECFLAIASSNLIPKVFLTSFTQVGNADYSVKQCIAYNSTHKKLELARKIISFKFKDDKFLEFRSTNELMLAEARETKKIYRNIFGNDFRRDYEGKDDVNKAINIASNALYCYCSAIIHLLGLSLHIGFIHGNTRNAFVFDLSEFYKTVQFYEIIKNNTNSIKKLLDEIANMIYNDGLSLPDTIYALLS